MCKKGDYYSITNELRKKLLKQDISITLKNLDKCDIEAEAKILIAGILIRGYTNRERTVAKLISEYSKMVGRETNSISLVAKIINNKEQREFNGLMRIALKVREIQNGGFRSSETVLISLNKGDVTKLDANLAEKLVSGVSITSQLKTLLADYKIECDICHQGKTIDNFRVGGYNCKSCIEKHKEYTDKSRVLSRGILSQMAKESAKSIKKDI